MLNKGWTGERLEPFVVGETTVEHLHRYSAVFAMIGGKVILDIACGEGYGSNLMAAYAKNVIGVDISAETIAEATRRYPRPNLTFVVGRADAIPLSDNSVDAIISFETLEHHTKHQEMFREILRVLKHEGFLVMSTPDKAALDAQVEHANPHHVKELHTDEFRSLVENHFLNVKYYRQKIVAGSLIVPESGSSEFRSFTGSFESVREHAGLFDAVFNICIASNSGTLTIPSSIFDGRAILERSYLESLREAKYYKYGFLLLSPLVRIKNAIRRIFR